MVRVKSIDKTAAVEGRQSVSSSPGGNSSLEVLPRPSADPDDMVMNDDRSRDDVDNETDDDIDDDTDDQSEDWVPSKNAEPVKTGRPKRTSSRLKRPMQQTTLSAFYCEPLKKNPKRKSQSPTESQSPSQTVMPSQSAPQGAILPQSVSRSAMLSFSTVVMLSPEAPPVIQTIQSEAVSSVEDKVVMEEKSQLVPTVHSVSVPQPSNDSLEVVNVEEKPFETTAPAPCITPEEGQEKSNQSGTTDIARIMNDTDVEAEDSDALPDVIPAKELDRKCDALPDIVKATENKVDDGGELPDIVEGNLSVSTPSPVEPKPSSSAVPTPSVKKTKAPRGKKAAAAKSTPKQKSLPVVPETPEMASLTRKLSALQKQDLIDIIKRCVYFGQTPTSATLQDSIPKPNVKEFAKEMKRLLSAVRKSVPNSRWGSRRDHYCFLRCQAALNEFARVASEQISVLSKLEDWNGSLEYALSAGCSIMNLPTWDMDGDNYHEARLTGQLKELLGRAVPQLSFSASRAQTLLREIEDKHATEYLNVVVKILERLI